ncbi:MAG: 30S ribosomal protein S17 [Candidatus Paceibacterota bacterium]|jgi:small subunit ribosomal protein S17
MENNEKKVNKKMLKGEVISDKTDKTRTVLVKRYVKHPRYGKYITISQKYKVHDPENRAQVGQTVMIRETRPISKDKHFIIVETK